MGRGAQGLQMKVLLELEIRNEKWWWRLRREYIWGDARK